MELPKRTRWWYHRRGASWAGTVELLKHKNRCELCSHSRWLYCTFGDWVGVLMDNIKNGRQYSVVLMSLTINILIKERKKERKDLTQSKAIVLIGEGIYKSWSSRQCHWLHPGSRPGPETALHSLLTGDGLCKSWWTLAASWYKSWTCNWKTSIQLDL